MNSLNISSDNLPQAVTVLNNKIDELSNRIEQLLNQSINHQPVQDQLLTVKQAAEFLKLTPQTIYSKVRDRLLPFMKEGKRLYFSKNELIAYLKVGKTKSYDEIEAEAEAYMQQSKSSTNFKSIKS